MNRSEAVICLKEILINSDALPEIFSILASDKSVNEGFKIKINTAINEEFRKKINSIAEKYGLSILECNNHVIIYQKEG